MGETQYLSVEDVIALHDDFLDVMGDSPAPLLDRNKLEAAIMRSQNVAFYEGADLIQQAVTLAVGVSLAHAFVDGNKRAGFAAADVFLRINGWVYDGPRGTAGDILTALVGAGQGESRDTEIRRFEALLRAHTVDDSSFQ